MYFLVLVVPKRLTYTTLANRAEYLHSKGWDPARKVDRQNRC